MSVIAAHFLVSQGVVRIEMDGYTTRIPCRDQQEFEAIKQACEWTEESSDKGYEAGYETAQEECSCEEDKDDARRCQAREIQRDVLKLLQGEGSEDNKLAAIKKYADGLA